jgi:hypothetical protein
MSEVFTGALAGLSADPTLLLIGGLCVFLAGALSGAMAREAFRSLGGHDADAGDTHAHLPDTRTASSAVIERDVEKLLRHANHPTPRPRLRAVSSPPLKPSYDGRVGTSEPEVCYGCKGLRGSLRDLPADSPLRCKCRY